MSNIIKQDDFMKQFSDEFYNNHSNFYDFIEKICSKKENIEINDVDKFMLDILKFYQDFFNKRKYKYDSQSESLFFSDNNKVNDENDMLYKVTPLMMEIIGYVMYHNNYITDKYSSGNNALHDYIMSFQKNANNNVYSKDFYLYGLIARIALSPTLYTHNLFKNIDLLSLEESNSILSKIVSHYKKGKISLAISLSLIEYNIPGTFYNLFKQKLVDINDLFLINKYCNHFYAFNYKKDINKTINKDTLYEAFFHYNDDNNNFLRNSNIRRSMYISSLIDNIMDDLQNKYPNLNFTDIDDENIDLSQFKIKDDTNSFFSNYLLFSQHSQYSFFTILKKNNDLNNNTMSELFSLSLRRPKDMSKNDFDFYYSSKMFDNNTYFTEFTQSILENLNEKQIFLYSCYLISLSKKYPANKNFQVQLANTVDKINQTHFIDDFFQLFVNMEINNHIILKKIITLDNFVYIMDTLNKDFSLLSSKSVNILKNAKLNKDSLDILYKNGIKKSIFNNILNIFKGNKNILQNNTSLLENLDKNDIVNTKSEITFDNFSFELKYNESINNVIDIHKNIITEINNNNIIDLSFEDKQYIVNNFLQDFYNVLINCEKIINMDKTKTNVLEENIDLYHNKIQNVQNIIINSYKKLIESTNSTIKSPKL